MTAGFGQAALGRAAGPALVSPARRSTMEPSERPGDRITIEEMRLDLAARVGPYRLHGGKVRSHVLLEAVPAPIALGKGINKLPTFVRVELINGYNPIFLDLSNQYSSIIKLTQTFATYVDVILLSGEVLYATAYQITGVPWVEIKTTEVII